MPSPSPVPASRAVLGDQFVEGALRQRVPFQRQSPAGRTEAAQTVATSVMSCPHCELPGMEGPAIPWARQSPRVPRAAGYSTITLWFVLVISKRFIAFHEDPRPVPALHSLEVGAAGKDANKRRQQEVRQANFPEAAEGGTAAMLSL